MTEPVVSLPVMSWSNGQTAHDEVLVIAVIDYSFWANTVRLGSPRAGFAPTNVVLDFMPHFCIEIVLDKGVSKSMF